MKIIHAQYQIYREADGTPTTDKYIRAILEDGYDTMILAKPFFALKEYLDSGAQVLMAPEAEINHVNLEMAKGVKPVPNAPPVNVAVPLMSDADIFKDEK